MINTSEPNNVKHLPSPAHMMESLFIDTNDSASHHAAVTAHRPPPSHDDPYRYQHGFHNHHATEAFPGALPRSGTNIPQQHPYGLYAEHLNGTPFISTRDSVSNVYVTFESLVVGYVRSVLGVGYGWIGIESALTGRGGCVGST